MAVEDEDEREREDTSDEEEADQERRPEETDEEEVIEAPDPVPGLTARLDHVTEEEKQMGPVAAMPEAGPDGSDVDAEARRGASPEEDEDKDEPAED